MSNREIIVSLICLLYLSSCTNLYSAENYDPMKNVSVKQPVFGILYEDKAKGNVTTELQNGRNSNIPIKRLMHNEIQTSGNWINYGGFIIGNPSILGRQTDPGSDHIFVRGGDNALWHYTNENWIDMGGDLTSNPCAIYDRSGRIHVFVRGPEGALWDNADGIWHNLGGYITSDPGAVLDSAGRIQISVRGGEYALWVKTLNTNDMSSSSWLNLGGYITSNPVAIYDPNRANTVDLLVRGSEYALWLKTLNTNDMSSSSWLNLGGYLTSNPSVYSEWTVTDWNTGRTYFRGFCHSYIFVRGGDYALWLKVLNTNDMSSSSWLNLGGYLTSNSDIGGAGGYERWEYDYDSFGNIIGLNLTDDNDLGILVRGGDYALWQKTISSLRNYHSYTGQNTLRVTLSSPWTFLGGYVTSDPNVVKQGYIQPFRGVVRGGEGAVWMYKR